MKPICIFDLDDTLIDSSLRFELGVLKILDEDGVIYDAELIKRKTVPLGLARTAALFCEAFHLRDSEERVMERINEKLATLYSEQFGLKPGVRAYLERLTRERNRLFVLTASPKALAVSALKSNGILELFEEVWSTEEDFGLHKDDTALFYEVTQKLETPPSLIRYFDDSLTAVQTAKKVGLNTYFVCNGQKNTDLWQMRLRGHAILESFEDLV